MSTTDEVNTKPNTKKKKVVLYMSFFSTVINLKNSTDKLRGKTIGN
jgi:hypothetical protein